MRRAALILVSLLLAWHFGPLLVGGGLMSIPVVGGILGWLMPDFSGQTFGFYVRWLIGAVLVYFLLLVLGFFTVGIALPGPGGLDAG